MSRDRFDDNEQLPPWLRDVPLPPRPAGMRDRPAEEPSPTSAPAGPPAAQRPAEDAELPDWLRDLGADSTPEASASAELPSWLRSQYEAPTPPSGGSDIPDWLRDADKQPPAARAEDSLPNWLRDEDKAPVTQPPEPPSSAESLPTWLTDVTPDEPDHSPAPAAPDDLQSWLRERSDQPAGTQADAAGTRSAGEDLGTSEALPPAPPQVAGSAETPAPVPAPPAPPDTPEADESGIPGWLRDIPDDEIRKIMEDDEESITAEPFSFESAAEPAPGEAAASLPTWLADISESDSGTPGALPAWIEDTTTGPSQAATPAQDESDVPAWLRDLGGAQAGEPAVTPPAGDSAAQDRGGPVPESPPWQDIAPSPMPPSQDAQPAWLQDMGQLQPEPGELAGELPAWLRAESGSSLPPSEDAPAWLKAAAPSEPPAEDVPAWLKAAAPSEPPAEDVPAWSDTEAPEPQAQDLPSWLDDVPTMPPPAGAADLPSWLRADEPPAPAEPAAPEPGREATPPQPGEELPPWLRDDAGQPLPTAGPPGDTNLPEWLRGAPAVPRAEKPQAPAELPGWLRDQPAATPSGKAAAHPEWPGAAEPSGTREPAPGESEFFGGAELPAWLRTPETEPAVEISPADARSLDWLTRLGAIEEESAGLAAAAAPKLPPRPAPTRTRSQFEALAILERLVAEPFPETLPAPAPAPARLWQRIGIERMLYLVLLVALLVALAFPMLPADLQTPPDAPGAADLFQQIDRLSANDVVLVGYEWDARRISELRPLEQAVLGQIIQKHVKLVLVSTDPQGTLLLFDLRDQLVDQQYQTGGSDYILLGYKPGGELALRSLAQDFRGVLRSDFQGNDASQGSLATNVATGQPRLATLNDLSLILVLADDASDVQGWMEQVHRISPQVPLAFLLPEEAAPIVQPYLTRPPIYHLAGRQGALAYQRLRGADGQPAEQIARESAQQRLGILVFIVLFLLGAIATGIAGAARRRKVS